MKILIKKEFDGNFYIGSCENIPGCYVQSRHENEISTKVKRALLLIKRNCEERNQHFPSGIDKPLFDIRIRFEELSTEQLIKFFEHQKYHMEYVDAESVILMNTSYPFNLVHLPRAQYLSPLLIRKIFGEKNTVYVGSKDMKYSSSISSTG